MATTNGSCCVFRYRGYNTCSSFNTRNTACTCTTSISSTFWRTWVVPTFIIGTNTRAIAPRSLMGTGLKYAQPLLSNIIRVGASPHWVATYSYNGYTHILYATICIHCTMGTARGSEGLATVSSRYSIRGGGLIVPVDDDDADVFLPARKLALFNHALLTPPLALFTRTVCLVRADVGSYEKAIAIVLIYPFYHRLYHTHTHTNKQQQYQQQTLLFISPLFRLISLLVIPY